MTDKDELGNGRSARARIYIACALGRGAVQLPGPQRGEEYQTGHTPMMRTVNSSAPPVHPYGASPPFSVLGYRARVPGTVSVGFSYCCRPPPASLAVSQSNGKGRTGPGRQWVASISLAARSVSVRVG